MQGLILHLKAVDGEDGKVKIKWNRKNDAVGEMSVPHETKLRKWLGRKRKRTQSAQ